jgi:hypothetical protein
LTTFPGTWRRRDLTPGAAAVVIAALREIDGVLRVIF